MSKQTVKEKHGTIIRRDAVTKYKVVEVDRVGSQATLIDAARRLLNAGKPQRVLVVPDEFFNAAKKAMYEVGVSGTVRNIEDTYRIYVSIPASNSTKPKK